MKSRRELLSWLNPELDAATAEGAGDLLDAVADYLHEAGPTRLFDEPPPLTFDPVTAASFTPAPVELTAGRRSRGPREVDNAELPWLPPQELADRVRRGELLRAQVIEGFAERIAVWNPALDAFIRVTIEAKASPESPAHGRFAGAPIGVQDMIGTAGVPTTAGSTILRDFVPETDAVAWSLLSAEGAVLAGKLNTHEFAAGTTGENPHFGTARNPWNLSRTAGGAAGGAGAAVAAGLVSAAIATDPGGSIRVPASHCGVVGLKPTYGAMDRRGSIPLTWTTETMGVLAQTVAGAAAVTDVLLDGRAAARYRASCEEATLRGSTRGRLDLRVGIPTNWLEMGLDVEVERSFRQALVQLVDLGATVVEVQLPDAAKIAPAHRAIAFSEASSIHEELLQTHSDQYGDNVRLRQEAGRGVMASEYLKAFGLRGGFTRAFSEVWRDVDVIATPTSPVAAAPIGTELINTGPRGDEPTHTVYTRYSAPLSTLGLPALSVPSGFTADGMPIGLQLCGPPHSEPMLFYVAAAYEAATPWHLRHPSLPVILSEDGHGPHRDGTDSRRESEHSHG